MAALFANFRGFTDLESSYPFLLFVLDFVHFSRQIISCFVDISANSCFEKDSSVAFIRPQKSRQKRRKTPSMIKYTFFEQDNESLFVSVSGIISFSN